MFSNHLFGIRWFRAIFSSTLILIFLTSYAPPTLASTFIDSFLAVFGFQKRNPKGVAASRPTGGGGRGECSNLASIDTDKQLTALIPQIEISSQPLSLSSSSSVELKSYLKSNSLPQKVLLSSNTIDKKSKTVLLWSKTIEEKPTLWFYIPYKYDEQSQLEYAKLALIDEDKHLVEKPIYFKLPKKPAIAQVRLPISLAKGKAYQWFFSVLCDENRPSRNPSVTGWIERVEQNNRKFVESSQAYIYYARLGLWYDGFTRLAKVYQLTKNQNQNQSYPNFRNDEATRIQEDWFNFFKTLQLSDDIPKEADILELDWDIDK
ncbi:MAG: DUF928 domain-containing protein [Nostoc sp.]|uniref:DUF928 domain-containing protein n=1 Tax=Nostoc sp. TaxID=1180 RepID=UPI002FFB8AD6